MTTDDGRMVYMTAEQAAVLDRLIEQMMRANDTDASKMMVLALSYKFAQPTQPRLPENVVEFPDRHSVRVGA